MTRAKIHAAVLQFPVTMDPDRNLDALSCLVETLPADALAVAPEGALSGYLPRPDVIAQLDSAATLSAIERASALASRCGVHIVAGACVRDGEVWRNRSYVLTPQGERFHYDKVNLATSERGVFTPGDVLPVFDLRFAQTPVRLGIQMCREIRYPEQWRALAHAGAEVIAYTNNAVASTIGDGLWRSHVVSRAGELQRFVLGANNAAPKQTCPSLIVSPGGDVLCEMRGEVFGCANAEIDLAEVSDWTIDQARKDLEL
jgi:predicted amidohydrolase